jgi:hypothetical protein
MLMYGPRGLGPKVWASLTSVTVRVLTPKAKRSSLAAQWVTSTPSTQRVASTALGPFSQYGKLSEMAEYRPIISRSWR